MKMWNIVCLLAFPALLTAQDSWRTPENPIVQKYTAAANPESLLSKMADMVTDRWNHTGDKRLNSENALMRIYDQAAQDVVTYEAAWEKVKANYPNSLVEDSRLNFYASHILADWQAKEDTRLLQPNWPITLYAAAQDSQGEYARQYEDYLTERQKAKEQAASKYAAQREAYLQERMKLARQQAEQRLIAYEDRQADLAQEKVLAENKALADKIERLERQIQSLQTIAYTPQASYPQDPTPYEPTETPLSRYQRINPPLMDETPRTGAGTVEIEIRGNNAFGSDGSMYRVRTDSAGNIHVEP